ncbi:hypothetical protein [Bilophila wadsworthia]|uniref:hypothetical protein n=1 Tax=Bilophila wadsworthia TaxID=35833 RepID=UPI00266CCA0A|nr:hypothetical protein [Bilophila wadsworthia]
MSVIPHPLALEVGKLDDSVVDVGKDVFQVGFGGAEGHGGSGFVKYDWSSA